jgi:hypothetical protein
MKQTIKVKPKLSTCDLIWNLVFLHIDHDVHTGLGYTATLVTVEFAHIIELLIVVWLHLKRFKIQDRQTNNVIYLCLFMSLTRVTRVKFR